MCHALTTDYLSPCVPLSGTDVNDVFVAKLRQIPSLPRLSPRHVRSRAQYSRSPSSAALLLLPSISPAADSQGLCDWRATEGSVYSRFLIQLSLAALVTHGPAQKRDSTGVWDETGGILTSREIKVQLRHYLLEGLFKGNIHKNNDFWHFTLEDASLLARKNPALGADAPKLRQRWICGESFCFIWLLWVSTGLFVCFLNWTQNYLTFGVKVPWS